MASVLFQPMSAIFYSDSVGPPSEAPSTFRPLSLEHLFPSPQVQLLSRHHPGARITRCTVHLYLKTGSIVWVAKVMP